MKLKQAEIDWLTRWDLVDGEVDLEKVNVNVGGAMGTYLKVTNHGALTIGQSIWFRNQLRRDDIDLLVHELVHVGQYARSSRISFLGSYVWEVVRRRRYSHDHSKEAPAYERQDQAREIVREHGGPSGERTS